MTAQLKALALAATPDITKVPFADWDKRLKQFHEAATPLVVYALIERGERLQEALRKECLGTNIMSERMCSVCKSFWPDKRGHPEQHKPGCLAAIEEESP